MPSQRFTHLFVAAAIVSFCGFGGRSLAQEDDPVERARRACLYSSESRDRLFVEGELTAQARVSLLRILGQGNLVAEGNIAIENLEGIGEVLDEHRRDVAIDYTSCIRDVLPLLLGSLNDQEDHQEFVRFNRSCGAFGSSNSTSGMNNLNCADNNCTIAMRYKIRGEEFSEISEFSFRVDEVMVPFVGSADGLASVHLSCLNPTQVCFDGPDIDNFLEKYPYMNREFIGSQKKIFLSDLLNA